MGTARVIQEEETGTKQSNSKRVLINLKEKNIGTEMKNPKQGLTSTKDLNTMLPERHESPLP